MPSKFNTLWLDPQIHPEFEGWLEEDKKDVHSAYCAKCRVKFSLSNMGKRAATSHAESRAHINTIEGRKKQNMLNFVTSGSTDKKVLGGPSTSTATNNEVPSESTTSAGLATKAASHPRTSSNPLGFTPDSAARKAELIWAVHVVAKKGSFRAQEGVSNLFEKMFPDSEIAKNMQLSRTKASYLVCYGLAPFFKDQLSHELRFAKKLVVSFDESFNEVAHRLQMDMAVRLWDCNKNEVSTRYWNSEFLGHSAASDLFAGFKNCLGVIEKQQLLHVSMDGPAVNWAMLDLLIADMKKCEEDSEIIDVGSCGLHVLHGAFKQAFEKSGWQVALFLKSLHNCFKDSPARRAEFTKMTRAVEFPLKFCNCRWLENGPVCQRAITLFPHLKSFFETKKGLPDTFTIQKIKECLSDKLLLPKLHFFGTIAASFEPFLRRYQTEKPVFPFLHGDIENLLKLLIGRYVKSDVLNKANTTFKLIKVNFDDVNIRVKLPQIDIGIGTQIALKNVVIKDLEIEKFRHDCMKCLIVITKKLVERSPVRYRFTKAASCLDPSKIASSPEKCILYMGTCLETLVSSKHLVSFQADRAKAQFKTFVSGVEKSKLLGFDRDKDRLDRFYASELHNKEEFKDLWESIKMILLFSHGQAFVESGFSINKELLIENLKEETLVALRRVTDGIAYAGGEDDVEITSDMLKYARNACNRYKEALRQNREKKEQEEKNQSKGLFDREAAKRKQEELSKLEKEKWELLQVQAELEQKIKKLKK